MHAFAHRRGWLRQPARRRYCAILALVGGALWLFATAGWIEVKATLAQHLIASAWAASGAGGEPVKPWPWADTWPVARLRVPRHGQDLYVLAGVSGQALAFGPGFELASVPPGHPGVSVIAGHRDTHFAFLRDLEPGTPLTVETPGRPPQAYRVTDRAVIDSAQQSLVLDRDGPSRLLLVTCYPFDSLGATGSLRLVVSAVAVERDGGGGEGPGKGVTLRASPPIPPGTANRRVAFSG